MVAERQTRQPEIFAARLVIRFRVINAGFEMTSDT
jgi:hypothetical protein